MNIKCLILMSVISFRAYGYEEFEFLKDRDGRILNDSDHDGIAGNARVNYQVFKHPKGGSTIIPRSLGDVKIEKDSIVVKMKNGSTVTISNLDGSIKDSASGTKKQVTQQYIRSIPSDPKSYEVIISDKVLDIPGFTRITDVKKEQFDISRCTVNVGQSIACPEGTYKFIGSNTVDGTNDSSRKILKTIEDDNKDKADVSKKSQSK